MFHSVQIAPGDRIAGKYRVERVLGTGATSVVVAARHEVLERTVALKVLERSLGIDADAIVRFTREARAAAALNSEHIVRVTDIDVDDSGRHFLVMEHLEGDDLAAVLKREGPLPIEQAVGYVVHACAGMAKAHQAGILHRDLKPQNLFLTRGPNAAPRVKVLDFGVSKIVGAGLSPLGQSATLTGCTLIGTPRYMSPEQLRASSAVDERTDVWALGVVLFELLTGAHPFAATTLPELMAAILSDDRPRLVTSQRADIPMELSAIINACLEKEGARRMPSAAALARALAPWTPPWARVAAHHLEEAAESLSAMVVDGGGWRGRHGSVRRVPWIAVGAASLGLVLSTWQAASAFLRPAATGSVSSVRGASGAIPAMPLPQPLRSLSVTDAVELPDPDLAPAKQRRIQRRGARAMRSHRGMGNDRFPARGFVAVRLTVDDPLDGRK